MPAISFVEDFANRTSTVCARGRFAPAFFPCDNPASGSGDRPVVRRRKLKRHAARAGQADCELLEMALAGKKCFVDPQSATSRGLCGAVSPTIGTDRDKTRYTK